MLNHNKLCGVLDPECVRIELPDLVFAVGFYNVEIMYTHTAIS